MELPLSAVPHSTGSGVPMSPASAAISNRRDVVKKKIMIREKEGQTARAMARAEKVRVKARAKARAQQAELERAIELKAIITIQAATRRSLVLLQCRKANGTYLPPIRKARMSSPEGGDNAKRTDVIDDSFDEPSTEHEKLRLQWRYEPRNQPRILEYQSLVDYPAGFRSPRPAELESRVVEGRALRATEKVVPCAPVTRAFAQVLQRQQSQQLLAYQESLAIEMSRGAKSKHTEEYNYEETPLVLAWGQEATVRGRSPSPVSTSSRPASPASADVSFRATGSTSVPPFGQTRSTPTLSRRGPALPAATATAASASAAAKIMDAPAFQAAAQSFKKLDVAPIASFRKAKSLLDAAAFKPSASEVPKAPLETIFSPRQSASPTPDHMRLQRAENNSFGLATVGDRELVMTVMAKAEAQRVEAELQLSRAL